MLFPRQGSSRGWLRSLHGLHVRIALALVLGTVSPSKAFAWDADAHLSIFQAAAALSPSFRKQLPSLQRDALERGVREADPVDGKCLSHRTNPKQTALARAAMYYEKVKAVPPGTTSRSQALLVGQFIHYLADVTIPRLVLKMEEDPRVPLNIHDLVVPRLPRPLGDKPFAEILRERAEEALQPSADVSSLPEVFRLSVNFLLDVFDSLPSSTEARRLAPQPDGLIVASPAWIVARGQFGGPGFRQMTRLKVANFHLLDWTAYPTTTGHRVRALVYNATDLCISDVFLHSDEFEKKLRVDLTPGALKILDFEGPEGLPDDVHGVLMRGDCTAFDRSGSIGVQHFIFANLSSGAPLWDHTAEGVAMPPLPTANYSAVSLPQRALGGLVIESISTSASSSGWYLTIGLFNKSEKTVAPVVLEVEIRDLGGALRGTHDVVFQPAGLERGEKGVFGGGIISTVGPSQADWLRIVGVRRSLPRKAGRAMGRTERAEPVATPASSPPP